jgi:hypothetical protein
MHLYNNILCLYSQCPYSVPGLCTSCGRRRNKRYDSTILLLNTLQLIYKDWTRVLEYTQLVWPSTRGVARSPQGSPWAQASAGRRRGQRSDLWGGDCWRWGYRCYGDWDGAAGPGRAKNLSTTGKTVPGLLLGGAREEEGEETSGSENKTCWVAAGPPGRLPGGRPRRHGLPGVASASLQALRRLMETISCRDLTLMVKEWGPCCKTV